MEKLDLTKLYKSYFTAPVEPEITNIEAARFLSITGKGDPADEGFAENTQALYTTAYAVKFICKAADNDFTVAKLEGLWWFDEGRFGKHSLADAPEKVKRGEWEYRLLIRMPEFVTDEMIAEAIQTVIRKKQVIKAQDITGFDMHEGRCVQALHVGPFATEPVTLRRMVDFMTLNGLVKNGIHHEIYLSDFRKTAPDKLKTILRTPVSSQ